MAVPRRTLRPHPLRLQRPPPLPELISRSALAHGASRRLAHDERVRTCARTASKSGKSADQRGNAPLGLARFGEAAAAVAAAVAPDSPSLGPSLNLSLRPSLSLSLGPCLSLSLGMGLACTPFDRPGLRSPSSSSVSLGAQG